MMGHRILGITSLFCGAPMAARDHLEQALELYNPQRDQVLAYRYGQEPRASILAWLAVTLWLLGSEDQAVRMVDEAIEHAREVGHTNTLAYTLFYGGTLVHQLRGDPQAVARYADGALRLAREHQLSMWGAYAAVGLGWARAAQGRDPDAVASMLAGLAELKASGTGLLRPHLLGWLADAQARCGLGDEALRVVAEALSTGEATGERWCEPGLYLLKGKLLSAHAGRDSDAQRAFQRAAEIARIQGCVALERKGCC
jgi:predicted ATPase